MSVSEFRYAVFSGSVWNELVELDDELFLAGKGEGLCLSILTDFFFWYCIFQFLFQLQFLLLCLFIVSFFRLFSISIYLKFSFSRIFEKLKIYLFRRGKIDNLFVAVG